MRFAYLIEPPSNYRTEEGVVTGCDVELARTVLAMMGIETLEFIEAEFAELLPGLQQHRWDITTGLFDTAERRTMATFSRPIWALSDGLLVPKGNPKRLNGYLSVASSSGCKLAAIHGQVQHQAAISAGIPKKQIVLYPTYEEAANAVLGGHVDAYASVAMAHEGYLARYPHLALDVIAVAPTERTAAFGAFGYRLSDIKLKNAIDVGLAQFLGSKQHRSMMRSFGFTDASIDLITPHQSPSG